METQPVSLAGRVRWAFDANDSFASDSTVPSSPETTTSTLAFVNSQLIAHGFLRSPGLQLQDLGPRDQDMVAKCLTTLLGQRVNDMSRSEELSTKLRTLIYDHERLTQMYRTMEEKTAHAEREAELAKSKMNAANKSLAAEQAAHKQTSSTLQKTKSALQFSRSTAQNEIKRKEKEVENVMERWSKISNEQARLGSVGTGMDCANLAVVEAENLPTENPLLEQALADAEVNNSRLTEENDSFRDVILSAACGLQTLLNDLDASTTEAPPTMTAATFFTPSNNSTSALYDATTHALNAHSKLKDLLASLRRKSEDMQALVAERLMSKEKEKQLATLTEEKNALLKDLQATEGLVQRMKEELATQQASSERDAQHRAEIEELMNDPRYMRAPRKSDPDRTQLAGPTSTSELDETSQKLAEREQALEHEREELNSAAVRLGQERAALEAERQQLIEERRAWEDKQLLSQVPDTPALRREKDIEKALGTSQTVKALGDKDGVEPGTGRVHQVRRGRSSVGLPSNEIEAVIRKKVKPTRTSDDAKSRPSVRFSEQVRRSSPPDSHDPRDIVRPSSPMGFSHPHGSSNAGHSEPVSPTKTTNPFEEVLLRSAQRPKPVFDGKGLPSFRPVAPVDFGKLDVDENETDSASVTRDKQTSPPQPLVQSPRRVSGSRIRNVNPALVTPPIFTHRRVVGKKHQYTPAVPSPLSKIVRMADSSSEVSSEDADGHGHSRNNESFSPTNALVAAIVASGGRLNGGMGSLPRHAPSPISDFETGDEDDDDGAWVPAEDGDSLPPSPTKEGGASATLPRQTGPMTEDELSVILKPTAIPPPRLVPKKTTSESTTVKNPVRPKTTTTTKAASRPVRTGIPSVKTSVVPAAAAAAKGKEKENVPARNVVKMPVPLTSPIKRKPIPGKVVMGKPPAKTAVAAKTSKTADTGTTAKVVRPTIVRSQPVASRTVVAGGGVKSKSATK